MLSQKHWRRVYSDGRSELRPGLVVHKGPGIEPGAVPLLRLAERTHGQTDAQLTALANPGIQAAIARM